MAHLSITYEEFDERLRAEVASQFGCDLSLALYVDVAYKTMLELRAAIEAKAPELPLFFRECHLTSLNLQCCQRYNGFNFLAEPKVALTRSTVSEYIDRQDQPIREMVKIPVGLCQAFYGLNNVC